MNNIRVPIFIGGLMKSGTSLLRKLLSEHPYIFGGLETHWFAKEFDDTWKDPTAKRQKWLLEFYDVDEGEVKDFRASASTSLEFFNSFMEYCTDRAGKQRWVEKTPDNAFNIDKIQNHWPNAKIILTKRDLRDVYASWKKNNKYSLDVFMNHAERYLNVLKEIENNSNVLVCSYSDLVQEPKAELKRILHFIEEPFVDGMDEYAGDDKDYKKVLRVTGKSSPTTESLSKPIFTSSIDQWKSILNKNEIVRIAKLK